MNIKEMIIGGALLLGLILFQVTMRRSRIKRMKRWWELANKALEDNDFSSAEQALTKCVALVPHFVSGRIMLGLTRARQGKLDAAEEQFKMAAHLEPRKSEGHEALAAFYTNFLPERTDDAFEALEEAVKHNPELRSQLAEDPRFVSLRDDPRFHALQETS